MKSIYVSILCATQRCRHRTVFSELGSTVKSSRAELKLSRIQHTVIISSDMRDFRCLDEVVKYTSENQSKEYSKVLDMIRLVLRPERDLHNIHLHFNGHFLEGSFEELTDLNEPELLNLAERDFQLYIECLRSNLMISDNVPQ